MKLLILTTFIIMIAISGVFFLLKIISNSSKPNISKKSILLGGIFIISGILLVGQITASNFDQYTEKQYRYTDITIAPANVISALDMLKKSNNTAYLVLYKDSCSSCIHAESRLTKAIIQAKKQHKSVFLLNINKMNSKQKEIFKEEYKEILYDGKIATPTVAELKGTGTTWRVIVFDNTGDIKKQIRILEGM